MVTVNKSNYILSYRAKGLPQCILSILSFTVHMHRSVKGCEEHTVHVIES